MSSPINLDRLKLQVFIASISRRGSEMDLVADVEANVSRFRAYGNNKSNWVLPSPSRPAKIIESKYRAGMLVKHPTWGEGIVLESRGQGDDEIVDVVFNSVGIKRLSASLANLTIIKH